MAVVRYEREGHLGIITLNNPPVNAVSWEVVDELRRILIEIGRSDVRAVLTKADGGNFSAGADINIFVGQTHRTSGGLLSEAVSLIGLLEALPVPTIVAVHGFCITAGMEIMLAHDIVFAAASTKIGQAEAMLGTTTLAGGAQRIAARAGVARAKEMVFEARLYDAATMERWNIVNRVVPDDKLQEKAMAYAVRMASGPTSAHGVSKRMINAYAASGTAQADQVMAAAAPHLFETGDMQRSIEQFLKHGARAFASEGIPFEGK